MDRYQACLDQREQGMPGLKLLFVTRKFPPHVGGMEKAAWEMHRHLSRITQTRLVKVLARRKAFAFVFPYLMARTIIECMRWKPDVIYLQDATLSFMAPLLRTFRKPIVTTMHGLEITYPNAIYQMLVRKSLRSCDVIVCISEATAELCRQADIEDARLRTILYAISHDLNIDGEKEPLRKALESTAGIEVDGNPLLISVGRLIERKGFHWFVDTCFSELARKHNDVQYAIAGDGEMRDELKAIIDEHGLQERVHVLGRIDDHTLRLLLNAADLFVMPNLKVPGDMEGFGLVSIEAGSCGLPVVASRVDGISEALGSCGVLVEPGDQQGFVSAINSLLEDPKRRLAIGRELSDYVRIRYNWEQVALQYKTLFEEL